MVPGMARTPLATRLQRNAAAAEPDERRTDRARFLRDAGAFAVAASAVGRFAPSAGGAVQPRIVVVGAGLAGLTCAYRLKQAGFPAEVHEAAGRVGGRCWTIRDTFQQGQIAEHGGELIDTGHRELRNLAKELKLNTVDLLAAEAMGTDEGYFFDNAPYSHEQATTDFQAVKQKLAHDLSAASYPTLFDSYTQRGYELDHMSVIDWIEESVPGGIGSRFGQLLDVAYNIEYGAESSVQSALNLVYLLGYATGGPLSVFGKSDERYHIVDGNDQVPARLAAALASQITTGSVLTAISLTSGARLKVTFQEGSSTRTVTADKVVLALPFSLLRSVDYSGAGFSPVKRTAIQELAMGTNSKLHLQFKHRRWESLGLNGSTYSDTGYQSTWDVTRGQAGQAGILVDYTGGTIGASFGSGTVQQRAKKFLGQIEAALPGITAEWNGMATLDFWPSYPWTKGSYSYWQVGQYTKFSGAEGRKDGDCHFAGEHTSTDFQGYLNGAVESGERAASEIVADLK
jgi:monoamine oxidase